MLYNRSSSVVALALLFALVAAPKPKVAILGVTPVLAQSATQTPFPLPSTVAQGTTVRIDGSNSMTTVNQALKQRFEGEYTGTSVTEAYNGTAAGLQALLDGNVDLAAIGRPLTAAEKAEGLTEVAVGRSKIAIIVGTANPFTGELTFEQFARIFRGEITDWSQVGGAPGPIRFIDHPQDSDTRQAFSRYPVFQAAPFEAGATAVALTDDSADAIVSELGSDGISYITASQGVDRPGVRIVPMHQTLPTDPRYPYSQPLVYVYQGEPSPAVAAFLGFATAPVGQAAVAAAGAAIVANPGATAAPPATTSPETIASPTPEAAASPVPSPASPTTGADQGTAQGTAGATARTSPWLWLLPLLLGIPLLLWLLGRRRGAAPVAEPPPTAPSPGATPPAAPKLADRAGTVISADRTAIADTRPPVPVLPETPPEPIAAVPPAEPPVNPLVVAAGLAGGTAVAGLAAANRRSSNRIILTPRTTSHAYAYWEAPEENREALQQQGGERYTLKVYDVTGIDLEQHPPHNTQVLACAEPDQDRFVPNLQSDRDYIAEIGYLTNDNEWLSLARSAPIRMPSEPPLPDSVESEIAPTIAPLPAAGTLTAAGTAVAAAGTAVAGAAWLNAVPAKSAHRPNHITLSLREPQQAYAAWEVPEENKAAARQQGGQHYTLRVLDVTGINSTLQAPLSIQQFTCQESDADRLIPVPQVDRDYIAEIGYLTDHDQWLLLARSAPVRVPGTQPAPDLGSRLNLTIADGQQEAVEATKFNLGQPDLRGEDLADVDANLPALADGYGDSQIFLLPRDPNWAYTYWDVPNEQKAALRQEGGSRLALRFYDVTGVNLDQQRPHSLQQYDCDELAHDWYLPVPLSDRDYIVEIGYLSNDGRWLLLARSNSARIPPVYPSGWIDDQFVTVDWQEDLRGQTKLDLPQPASPSYGDPIYDRIFNLVKSAEAERIAGSLFGSMQQSPEQALSSYSVSGLGLVSLTESGAGMMSGIGITGMSGAAALGMSSIGVTGMSGAAIAGLSGIGMSGVGATSVSTMSGAGMSGVGMSGVGISGVGMSGAGMPGVGISGMGMMSGIGAAGLSGIGIAGMSGIGITGMSGAAALGMSGVGMTGMSGIGMLGVSTMSGIGMSGVGMELTLSGIGLSGMGMTHVPTMSGIGYAMSGAGLSGAGIYTMPTMSGVGMSGAGIGFTMSGVGMSGAGVYGIPTMSGMEMSGAGMSGSGMGLTMSGVGLSGVGMYSISTMSGMGMSGIGMGLTMSGVGMSGTGIMSGVGMSGVGMYSIPTMSGMGMSGVGMSGMGMGFTMSGVGMSGVGFSASMPPIRPRKFWLVANAELIVHGATEPDATVWVGDREIKLSPDGTFRFQVAFPDGDINYPILAVAADGEQTRSIRMDFNRETPVYNGNPKEAAIEEWLQ